MARTGTLVLYGVALYLFSLVFAASRMPGYDHTQRLISELGQTGAPMAMLWRSTLVIAGTLVILLARALDREVAGSRSKWGPALIATTGAGLVLGGFFQCDPGCVPVTFHGWTHILTSIPATLAALVGPFVLARRLDGDPRWKKYASPSRVLGWISIATISGAFFLFPKWGIPGVGQRIATFTQLFWLSLIAFGLARMKEPGAWPPGPSGLRALRMLGWRRELIAFTERCRREFGGICGIRLGGTRLCIISDPLHIERVFVHHASRVKKWDPGQFDPILGKGLLTSNGELWKKQRSLIQPAFQPSRIEDYVECIEKHARELVDGWPSEGTLDLHEEMLRVSLKISASALFGADSSELEALVSEMQHLLMSVFEDAVSGVPIPLSVPTPRNLKARRAIRALDGALMKLIARRRADAPGRDFLGAMQAAGMSDQQLRDEAMTMMLASHETTGLVLTWTLWLLARHPAIARELEAELAGGESALLKNVVTESMRLYPPVWAIGRVSTEAIDLGPWVLPAGTQIFLVPYIAHRDPAVFDQPEEFRPRRWEDPKLRTIPRCSYMPFGSGPRKCVGMHFALRETTLILSEILRRVRLEGADDIELQASVTLRPAKGVKLRFRRIR